MTNPYQKLFVLVFFLSVFTGVHRWLIGFAFAGQPTPSVDTSLDVAAKDLEKAKDEVQKLKDAWDKTRLETTLYEQRAKRAYQKWVKASKSLKDRAKAQKDRADLEFQLALEKRKLAYNEWQAAQDRLASREDQVKALDQEKESAAIQEKIKQLETKLSSQSAVRSSR